MLILLLVREEEKEEERRRSSFKVLHARGTIHKEVGPEEEEEEEVYWLTYSVNLEKIRSIEPLGRIN